MAAAPGWTSNADAVQAFVDDVLTVAVELGLAGDVGDFTASLRELVELATEHLVLVDDNPDGTLVVRTGAGTFPRHDRASAEPCTVRGVTLQAPRRLSCRKCGEVTTHRVHSYRAGPRRTKRVCVCEKCGSFHPRCGA